MSLWEAAYAHPWWTTAWLFLFVLALPTLKVSWSRQTTRQATEPSEKKP